MYLVEEASEVIKAATKILRHGYGDETTEYNNRLDLETELVDFAFGVNLLMKAKEIDSNKVDLMIISKNMNPPKYLHYQGSDE